ncbi:MAG TPA: hypothetical protein VHA52_05890, partial [Candidatus Babeliaceae bacterium]|nr:hypothetical protein [Candidatus Babeliaceae bacterium]
KEIIKEIFPQELLQAIIFGNVNQVKQIIESDPNQKITTDNDGVSALVYAASQADPQIVSLLLKLQAYCDDTKGWQQAYDIINERLKGLPQTNHEYQLYREILQIFHRTTLDALVNEVLQQPNPPDFLAQHGGLPRELSQYIISLASR